MKVYIYNGKTGFANKNVKVCIRYVKYNASSRFNFANNDTSHINNNTSRYSLCIIHFFLRIHCKQKDSNQFNIFGLKITLFWNNRLLKLIFFFPKSISHTIKYSRVRWWVVRLIQVWNCLLNICQVKRKQYLNDII